MAYTHYTPLSMPTRLAAGLGLKEIPYPNGIRPFFGSPASQSWIKLINILLYMCIFYHMQYESVNFPEEWMSMVRSQYKKDSLLSLVLLCHLLTACSIYYY